MKHQCTPMTRAMEMQTIDGQQAFALYKAWLLKTKRSTPTAEAFMASSYYSSFSKFVEWSKEIGLPNVRQYSEVMMGKKLSPTLWRRPEAYQLYLEFLDHRTDPIDQAATTIETMITFAEHLSCEVGDVLQQLKPFEVLELVHQRRLSPWLLFCSKTFKSWYQGLNAADRHALMRGIGVDFWALKLEKNPKVVEELKQLAESIGM